ncbi:TolB family protein [Actinomadura macra]|uniref:TolB family protein n=1 Tax=Actinomadura macra TaxID=46164 RepID=UPI000832267B|nr:hypothetical protein [Actinomadura macra]
MTRLNDDLVRAALSDGAGVIDHDDLRPLAAPARRPRRRRWAIPAGAAVTALAAASVAVLVVAGPHQRDAGGPAMSLAAYAGAEYVVDGAWPNGGEELTISEVSSRRVIARVPAPRDSSGFLDAAGTGDNRTFVLTTAAPGACRVRLHRLTLRDNGTPASVSELSGINLTGRQGEGSNQLAVAKGGERLAYSTLGCGAKSSEGHITVVDLSTGAQRVVDLPPGAKASDLRWAPDGRQLAFRLAADGWDGYRLNVLDAVTGARTPVSLGPPGTRWNIGVIAPDGRHLVAVVTTGRERRLIWYSLISKTVTRQVPLAPGSPDDPVISGGGTGDALVILIGDRLYRVRGTHVESKQVPPGTSVDLTGTW